MYLRLILVAASAVLAQADSRLNCEPGATWVENYVKFECFHNENVYRGVRPIGCVPTNTADGAMMVPGTEDAYFDDHFVYRCFWLDEEVKNTLLYKSVRCKTADGKQLSPGTEENPTEHTQPDGKIVQCVGKADGSVEKRFKIVNGCQYDGELYEEGHRWVVKFDDESGDGTAMNCEWNTESRSYESVAFGCTRDGRTYHINKLVKIDGKYYKCEWTESSLTVWVQVENSGCLDSQGESHGLLQAWNDPITSEKWYCREVNGEGVNYLLGCGDLLADGSNTYLYRNSIRKVDDKWYWCKLVDGVYRGVIVQGGSGAEYCTFEGERKDLLEIWVTGTTRYKCNFRDGSATVSMIGCSRDDIDLRYRDIVSFAEGTAHLCDRVDGRYQLRELTAEEYAEWWAAQQRPDGDGGSISGGGGGGGGASRTTTTKATTTTTATTTPEPTTTEAPTTVAETTVAETTVAETTVAETTVAETTVAETTVAETTVAETTVAETTVAETTVVETTVAETTVAETTVAETTVVETTVAETTVAETTPAETEEPTTEAETTVAETTVAETTAAETTEVFTTPEPAKCEDLTPLCHELAMVCQGDFAEELAEGLFDEDDEDEDEEEEDFDSEEESLESSAIEIDESGPAPDVLSEESEGSPDESKSGSKSGISGSKSGSKSAKSGGKSAKSGSKSAKSGSKSAKSGSKKSKKDKSEKIGKIGSRRQRRSAVAISHPKNAAKCGGHKSQCEASGEGSFECALHDYHCCPCAYEGCGGCAAPEPECKDCDDAKIDAVKLVQAVCPVTCNTCDQPATEIDVEVAAGLFAQHFLVL